MAEDSATGTLTNNGVIWNDLPSGSWPYGIMSAGRVVNNGKVVSQYDTDSLYGGSIALGIMSVGGFARGTAAAIQNSGQVFAISADKQAVGLWLEGLGTVINSGIVAVKATGDYAYTFGVQFANDGDLDNRSGGQILAESHYATAVEYTVNLNSDGHGGDAATITNAGLIEAHSSDGEQPSYGIHAEHSHDNIFTIDNSGTITADYAIYFDTRTFQTAELSTEIVTNEATGVINGVIYLDLGDDQLINKGAIHGIVAMGWGDDHVDNSAGTIDGYTDLDLGNDTYVGGAGEDDVLGGRGNDTISGGGGDDLILGGYGDDTIDGGSGNDGLFGEYGNDTITAGKGDYVSGGPGDDLIKLTDFGGFYAIDGDTGFDTLQLPSASRVLDFSGVVSDGTLTGIDDLFLGHNLGLVLRAGDVAAISDADAVTIQADSSNHVYLLGSWSEASHRTVAGITYRVFDLSGSEVLIQNGTVVSVQASAPAGAAGFDAGSGVTPPFPNPDFLDNGVTQTDEFPLIYSLTIAADETWLSDQQGVFRSGDAAALVNYGTIAWRSDWMTVGFTYIAYDGSVANYGTIEASATGYTTPATAVYFFENGTFSNSGTVSAYSQTAFATGVEAFADFANTGTIIARSDSELQYTAIGVSIYNYGGESVTNAGSIQAYGNSAIGFQNENSGGYFTNSGSIYAESAAWYYPSIAIAGELLKITNTGTAAADIFTDARGYVLDLDNSGSIQGLVRGSEIADTVNNTGTIAGEVDLFAGDDVFDGHAGHQTGAIFAGDGNDTVTGGADAETIYGENGDDTIKGNGGNDTIDGGQGSDTVVFSGNRSDYRITVDAGQRVATVVDLRAGSPDGTDTIRDVQYFKFANVTIASGIFDDALPTGSVAIIVTSNGTAVEDHTITADTHLVADADGIGSLHYQWQHMDGGISVPDSTWVNVGTDSSSYTPGDDDVGKPMRVIVSFVDQHGTTEYVVSDQTSPVVNVDDPPTLSGIGSAVTFTALGSAVVVAPSITVADPDDTILSMATVTISGGYLAGDVLDYAFSNDVIGGHYDPNTHVLTLTGGASLAQYQAALRLVTFASTAADPSAGGNDFVRTVTFVGYDQDGLASTPVAASVDIVVPHVAPALTDIGNTVAYVEQASAIALGPALGVSDDTGHLVNATIAISTGYVSGDILNFTNQNGITGSWNAATHILTLSGSASVANYQAALRSITFSSTSDNPTNYGASTSRTVTWQVDDGQSANHASNTGSTTIAVTAVNDAPAITGAGNGIAYTEQASAVVVDSAIVLADPDSTVLTGATVAISSGYAAGDILAFANQNGITGSWNAATHVLTLSGSATLASYQAALRSITYASTSDNPTASSATRTVTWQVDDGQSANHASNAGTTTITVTAVNDAPVLSGAGNSVGYTEQGTAAVLDAALGLADPDNASLSGATVAISAGFVAGDVLNFVNQNGITGSYNTATHVLTLSGNASVANYQAALRSVTFTSSSDNPTNGGVSTARTVTWQVDDGQSANHASNTGSTTISVTAVNDAPVLSGAGNTVGYTEQASAIAVDTALTLADPDNASLGGATVKIASGFVSGDTLAFINQNGITGSWNAATHILTLSGNASVAAYQAALRSVSFATASDNPTNFGASQSRTISWQVDDGQSANHASNTGSTTISITGVNDAPVLAGAGNAIGYTEQAAAVALDAGLTLTDLDSSTLGGATVTISSGFFEGDKLNFANQNGISGSWNAATHVLTLSGTSSVANYQAALRSITFSSTSDNPTDYGTDTARQIVWQVDDGQPSNHASNTGTTTISITAVDDPASLHNDAFAVTAAYPAGTGLSVFADNGSGADIDPDTLLVVTAVNGVSGNVGHQITLASGALVTVNADGTFVYDPNHVFDYLAAPGSGASDTQATDSFTYTVNGVVETATVTVVGADDNDTLYGTSGNDNFFGGVGTDTLVLTGARSDYGVSFDRATATYTLIDLRPGSPDGTDTLHGIEKVQFTSGTTSEFSVFTETTTDSGMATLTTYDAANDHPWLSVAQTTDTQSSLMSQTIVTDEGTKWVNQYDSTGTQSWLWTSSSFDAAGHQLTEAGTNDDGTHWLTLFDAGGAYSWAHVTLTFDASWNQTGFSGTNDDDSHTVTLAQAAQALDTALWYTTPYDADANGPATNWNFSGSSGDDILFGFAGDDRLIGVSGNNYLDGGTGNDYLMGGPGTDRFVFHYGDGLDTVVFFHTGTDSADVIELHNYGISSFAQLQPYLTQVGGDVVIAFDDANHITLQGMQVADLNASEFVFA